jgi:hypothetical protein
MTLKKLDIADEMRKGWALFRPNMGLMIIAGLIATLLSAVTCGILSGPLAAGMFLLVRRVIKNDPVKPQAGDIFKGFDFFAQALLVSVICLVAIILLSMIPVLGQLAGLVVASVMMWAMLFVVHQKMKAIDAFKKVFGYLQTGEFTMPLLFALLTSVVSGLGAIACGIGVFFTIPLSYCMLACAYETLFGDATEGDASVPPPSADLRM